MALTVGNPKDLDTHLAEQAIKDLHAAEAQQQPDVSGGDSSDAGTDGAADSGATGSSDNPPSPVTGFPPVDFFQSEGLGFTRSRPGHAPTFHNYTRSGGGVRGGLRPLDLSGLHFGESFKDRSDVLARFAGEKNVVGQQRLAAFLDMMAFSEGTSTNARSNNGYNVMVGGGTFDSYADHPRQMVHIGRLGVNSSAAGRYQFLSTTWDQCARALGLHDFSPAAQDAAALYLVKNANGALDDVLNGNTETAIAKLGGIWASFPGSPYGQGGKSMAQEMGAYNAALRQTQTPVKVAGVASIDPTTILYVGDSIANGAMGSSEARGGLNARLGLTDLAVAGRNPYQIRDAVNAHRDQLVALAEQAKKSGKPIVILASLGASNSGSTNGVQSIIQDLKHMGFDTSRLVLMGTGARPDLAPLNKDHDGHDGLETIASKEGTAFTGPLPLEYLRDGSANWDRFVHLDDRKGGNQWLLTQKLPEALAQVKTSALPLAAVEERSEDGVHDSALEAPSTAPTRAELEAHKLKPIPKPAPLKVAAAQSLPAQPKQVAQVEPKPALKGGVGSHELTA